MFEGKAHTGNSFDVQLAEGYHWVAMIDGLADGDMTKWEDVTELNYISCLTKLSYQQAKNEVEEARAKKQQMSNRL